MHDLVHMTHRTKNCTCFWIHPPINMPWTSAATARSWSTELCIPCFCTKGGLSPVLFPPHSCAISHVLQRARAREFIWYRVQTPFSPPPFLSHPLPYPHLLSGFRILDIPLSLGLPCWISNKGLLPSSQTKEEEGMSPVLFPPPSSLWNYPPLSSPVSQMNLTWLTPSGTPDESSPTLPIPHQVYVWILLESRIW